GEQGRPPGPHRPEASPLRGAQSDHVRPRPGEERVRGHEDQLRLHPVRSRRPRDRWLRRVHRALVRRRAVSGEDMRPTATPATAPTRSWRLLIATLVLVAGSLSWAPAQEAPAAPPSDEAPGGDPSAAANPADRIITIDGSGGTQRGNLRSGPIIYEHPDARGITATVSTLTIYGSYVELTAPEGTSISRGGERTATFQNGVKVNRGRLTANGPGLTYSEATGLGVLGEGVEVVIESEEEGE